MGKAAVFDTVKDGDAFQNPASGAISGAGTGAASALTKVQDDKADVDAALIMDPGNPELLEQQQQLGDLEDRLVTLTTGVDNPSNPDQYRINTLGGPVGFSFALMLAHTNFFSGTVSTPVPVGLENTGVNPITVLSAANGIKQVSAELGRTDPSDPCKAVNDLLGSVLGKLADLLAPLLNFLNLFVGGLLALYDMLNYLDNLVQNMWQLINDEIAALKQYLADLAAWAMTNFINAMVKDPCLAAVLNSIATPTLKDSIENIDVL